MTDKLNITALVAAADAINKRYNKTKGKERSMYNGGDWLPEAKDAIFAYLNALKESK